MLRQTSMARSPREQNWLWKRHTLSSTSITETLTNPGCLSSHMHKKMDIVFPLSVLCHPVTQHEQTIWENVSGKACDSLSRFLVGSCHMLWECYLVGGIWPKPKQGEVKSTNQQPLKLLGTHTVSTACLSETRTPPTSSRSTNRP